MRDVGTNDCLPGPCRTDDAHPCSARDRVQPCGDPRHRAGVSEQLQVEHAGKGASVLADGRRLGSRHGDDGLAVRAEEQFALVVMSSDLYHRAAAPEPHDDGVLAESLDLIGDRRTLPIQPVGGHELVAEQERPLRPDQDVADPAPVSAPPLRPKTVDLAVRDPDDAAERPWLALHPALPRKHEGKESGDDDQIDTEDGEQAMSIVYLRLHGSGRGFHQTSMTDRARSYLIPSA